MDLSRQFDAIIVGAGPAGTSCALWLKQLGFEPLLLDKQDRCGGLQNSNPFSNTWIATSANTSGRDIAEAMHSNMVRHQIAMRLGTQATTATTCNQRVKVELSDGNTVAARFLVLAGGVVPKTGGFVERIGLLVGPGPAIANADFCGSTVAILGGGDNAVENYLFAKKQGALKVRIFARSIRARHEMLAQVDPTDLSIGEYVVDEHRQMVNGTHYSKILVFYGFEADRRALLGLDIARRPDGFVSTDPSCHTSDSLVYAVGEIAQRSHPCCATAMADGVVAAKAIQRRVEGSPIRQIANTTWRLKEAACTVFG